MEFSYAPNGIKLGDYGHFMDSAFCCEGNLFAEFSSLPFKVNITPKQHKISERGGRQRESGVVMVYHSGSFTELYKPLGLSLPSNDDFKSLLASLSTRFINRYLITKVIQCPLIPCGPDSSTAYWCNIAKPFVWHRIEDTGSVVGGVERRSAG
ncbi:hypothetical protein SCLCIDRAFT_1217449 [Scleroderma citrinum Foug A]|uniref:Uncharacterized protein n=1 Tax=Scleroderma citrinum Foug A TaxID=1036808 RepID=A0A0C3DGJ0_9AGAM|nr:hypothetical protein SCLCIDRAFT_1217449 [Scleroderma citrinum Foug A]